LDLTLVWDHLALHPFEHVVVVVGDGSRDWVVRHLGLGQGNQVSVGHVVTSIDNSSLPAVVTPSKEASISLEEKKPEVEDESNELELETVNVSPDGDWEESNVEDPDEYPSAWQAPSEEDSVPDPVKEEVDKLVNEQDEIPWSNGDSDDVDLKECGDDLENDTKGRWSCWDWNSIEFELVDRVDTADIEDSLLELVNVRRGIFTGLGADWLGLVEILKAVGAVGDKFIKLFVIDILASDGVGDKSVFAESASDVPVWSLLTTVVNADGPFFVGWDSSSLDTLPVSEVFSSQMHHVLILLGDPRESLGDNAGVVLELHLLSSHLNSHEVDLWKLVVVEELLGEELWFVSCSKTLRQLHI